MIVSRPFATNERTLTFVNELGDRISAAQRSVVHACAEQVLASIRNTLRGPEYAEYVNNLRLMRVTVSPPAFAIYAAPIRKKISKLDTSLTVLYVRPRARRMVRVPEYVSILARYSPWTFETLPVVPRRQEAAYVYRTVREEEVRAITKQREDSRAEWTSELVAVGVHPRKAAVFAPGTKASADSAFEALRIEFGLGTGAGKSHWRPALRQLANGGLQSMLSPSSATMRPVVDTSYAGWRLPPPVDGVVSVRVAAGFRDFQARVRV